MVMTLCYRGIAAMAHWSGVSVYNYGQHPDQTRDYCLEGGIHGQNGEFAEILSDMYGHVENGGVFLKHADYSRESLNPTFNWWVIALYGEVVDEANFNSHASVQDFNDYTYYSGGTLVENPNDFYMAFKVSEVLLENYDYVVGQTWYGWVHVSIDENLEMTIREEELKNKVAADFFGAFDCTRIIGNVDFCVAAKRSARPESLYWAEAKNHPTDVHQMLAQLILTIGRAASPLAAAAGAGRQPYHADEPPKFAGCFDNEKIAFVEYHHILPVFNLNDFNWTQTPSAVDGKTVETVRGVVPSDKIVVFRFGADDAEIKAFIRRNFTSGEGPALATPIDRNNFTFIYQKWRAEVMPHIDAPWDVLKKKYALYDRDFFLAGLLHHLRRKRQEAVLHPSQERGRV